MKGDAQRNLIVAELRRVADALEDGAELVEGGIYVTGRHPDSHVVHVSGDMSIKVTNEHLHTYPARETLNELINHLNAENNRLQGIVERNAKNDALKTQYRLASRKLGKQKKQLADLNRRLAPFNMCTVEATKLLIGLQEADPFYCGYAVELLSKVIGVKIGPLPDDAVLLEWPSALSNVEAPSQVAAEVVQVPRELLKRVVGIASRSYDIEDASQAGAELRALLATSQGEA